MRQQLFAAGCHFRPCSFASLSFGSFALYIMFSMTIAHDRLRNFFIWQAHYRHDEFEMLPLLWWEFAAIRKADTTVRKTLPSMYANHEISKSHFNPHPAQTLSSSSCDANIWMAEMALSQKAVYYRNNREYNVPISLGNRTAAGI